MAQTVALVKELPIVQHMVEGLLGIAIDLDAVSKKFKRDG